ncbi:MAG: TonB-dependent receptor, partial [Pedobacter sp.]
MQNFKKGGYLFVARSLFKNVLLLSSAMVLFLYLPFSSIAQTQPLINSTLKGQVIDSLTKQGIPGVSVHITGTTHSVQTNSDGRFDFVTGQKFPYTLEIRHVSYQKKDVIANGSPILITLKEISSQLNDVLIVGYGTQTRKSIVGSVAKVSAAETKQV